MKFKLDVMRGAVLAGLAMTLLASCGGGTQIEAFVPRRLISFGDEASLIVPSADGKPDHASKYAVNGVAFQDVVPPATVSVGPKSPVDLACTSNQIWVQQLAYSYGLAFAGNRCPGTIASPNGLMFADVGKKVADLKLQIDDFLVQGYVFASNDLVTVMMGTNDIIALYESQPDPANNAAALIDAAERAGTEVGAQVVRITDRGAKVLVTTIPSLGFSPYAAAEELAHPGEGRSAFLATLSERFNTKLRLKLEDVRDGGRAVGLVLVDDLVLTMTKFPTNYGLNATYFNDPACKPVTLGVVWSLAELLNCNMTNVVEADMAARTYGSDRLWADGTHLGAAAQGRIGSLAVTRARNNPF